MANQFNPIVPIDLSQDQPQANPHVPSVADPGKYQPQFTPSGYNMSEPEDDDKESPSYSELALSNAPDKVAADEVPFNPQDAKRYDKQAYNPAINNEDIYAKNQGVFSKVGNDVVKFGVGATTAFAETLMSIPDLLRTVAGGNAYKNAAAEGLETWQNNMENVFPNYYSDYEKEHPLLASIPLHAGFTNFLFDKLFKGSGLVVGTIAGAAVENAAIGFVTAGTGDAVAEGAIAKGAGSQLARIFGKMSINFSKLANGATEFQQYLNDSKITGQAFKDASKMEEYAAGVKLGNNLQYGLTLASSSNMMAAQGARETYKSIKDQLRKDFINEHGYEPDVTDMSQMESTATTAANTKYAIDFALFTLQNAVAFPNAMRGFGAAKAGLREGISASTEGQVGEIGLASKEINTAADIDNLKLTPESTKARFFRKYVKPESILTQASVMGLTHGSDDFVKNYYTHSDVKDTNNLLASTLDGLKSTFGSDGGIESMLLGGLTGALISPIEHKIGEIRDTKAGKLTPEKASQTALENMRKNSITGLFAQNYSSAADVISYAKDMKESIANDDIFQYKNLQADQLKKMILTGIRSNRFDVVREQIKMLKDLPEAELDKVMATPEDSQASLQDKHEYIDKVLDQADKLKRDYDAVSKVFLNRFDYRPAAKTEEDKHMNDMYLAYEGVKEDLIGASFDIRDRKARLEDIGEKLRDVHPDLSIELTKQLCSLNGLGDLQKQYEDRSHQLKVERDEMGNGKDNFSREQYQSISKERGILNGHIDEISTFLNDIKDDKASLHDQATLFQNLASFEMNGRNIEAAQQEIEYSKLFGDNKGIGGVLDMGKDIVRLNGDIDNNNTLIKALYTEKGFKSWMMHKAYMNEINAKIEQKKAEDAQAPIQVGDKQYNVGRTYQLQNGLELPKVESGTQKGDPGFFTKDYWGGVGAKLFNRFKDKADAEQEQQKNKEDFEKEMKSVTILGPTLDKNGNIKVKTANGRIENIDPALLENHVPKELPEDVVNSQKRYDINKEIKQHMEDVIKQNPYYMSIENFEDLDPETIGAILKTADIEARGRLKRSPFVYGATIQPPNGRDYVKNTQLFFSNHDQISKSVKIRGGELKMIFVHSDNAQALGLGDIWARPDGTKGSLLDYLNWGTSAKEVNSSGEKAKYEEQYRIVQEKLYKLEDAPENSEKIKTLKSELDHIEYMYDNSTDLVSYNQNNVNERTIATVVVEKNGKDWHYIDSKGKRLDEVTNPEDLVINTMPVGMEGGLRQRDSRFRGDVSIKERREMIDAWRQKRDEIFALTSSEPPMYSYNVSRGFPKREADPENPGKFKQYPVVGSLIEKEDLHNLGLLQVTTEKGVSYMGENLKAPNGSVMIRKDKLLQFLNNRKLNTSEIDNTFEILKDFARHLERIKHIKFNTQDKNEQEQRDGFKKRLTDITNYLQGIIYYGRDTAARASDNKVKPGQLYISGPNIIIGNRVEGKSNFTIPFTIESFDESTEMGKFYSDKLREGLATLYTNANSLKVLENKPFKELYTERGENNRVYHKSRIWKSYQHFLLSDTVDLDDSDINHNEQDGKVNRQLESIPFTTSTIPKEDGKPNFQGQYAALKKTEKDEFLFEHVIKKEEPKKETSIEKKEEKAPQKPPQPVKSSEEELIQSKLDHPAFISMFGTAFDYKIYKDGSIEIRTSNIDNAVEFMKKNRAGLDWLVASGFLTEEEAKNEDNVKVVTNQALKGIIQESLKNITDVAQGSITDAEAKNKIEEQKPAATEAPKKKRPRARMLNPLDINPTVHNIEQSEAWLKANIPVPGERVYNIIKNTGGGYAWGEYCDTHVKYYIAAKRGTIEHEGFEAIWWSFTSANERARLMKEFRSREGSFVHHEDFSTINYKDASDYQIKEQLAEELGHYVLDGKEPPRAKKSSNLIVRLFQHVVGFVKGIFNNSIKDYFNKINTGYYKTAPRLNDYRGLEGMDKYSKAQIGPLSITDSHAIASGLACRLVQHLFSDNRSLVEFDTKRFNSKGLFNNLYEDIKTSFINDPNSEYEENENSSQSLFESGQIDEDTYNRHLALWASIQTHWASEEEAKIPEEKRQGSIIDHVREYLKVFGIKHEIDETDGASTGGNNQYRDAFEVNNDRTMSTIMKMLYSTVVEQVRDPKTGEIVEKIDPATNMPIPVNFSKMTGFTRENLKDCNTFADKMQRFAEMAKDNPNFAKIMERLKIDPETGKPMENVELTQDDLKLQGAFHNTFGKQRPDAVAMYVHDDGNVIFSSQNLNASTTDLVASWVDQMKLSAGNEGSPFHESVKEGEEGVYEFDGSRFSDKDVKGVLSEDKQIDFLKSLSIPFTKELIDRLSVDKQPGQRESDRNEFISAVRALYTYLPKTKDIKAENAGKIGAAGRLRTIASLYLKASGIADSTFFNIENRIQSQDVGHNFFSATINDINRAESLDELRNKLSFGRQEFRQDSWYLNKYLFENGKRLTDRKLALTYVQGIINEKTGELNQTLASMSHPQRLMAEMKSNLNQLYYVLVPADSKTEWAIRMQHIIKWDAIHDRNGAELIYNKFKDYYKTEQALAQDNPKYKSLMYDINGDYKSEELDKDKLLNYLENNTKEMVKYLIDTGAIIKSSDKGLFEIEDFPTVFGKEAGIDFIKNKASKKGTAQFTEAGLHNLFRFVQANHMLNTIEIFKLFLGDPNEIGDGSAILKRTKSFLSPRESSMYEDETFNNTLGDKLNKAANVGKDLVLDSEMKEDQFVKRTIKLTNKDYGYWNYTDEIRTIVTKDQSTYEPSVADDDRLHPDDPKLRAKLQDAYKHINPTDGSGSVILMAHREIMYKRGLISKAHDKMYDYLFALDRQLLYKDGHLQTEDATKDKYYSEALKAADEAIVTRGYGKNPNDTATLDVLKPIYSGPDNSGNLVLDKYSLEPLTYALVRKGPLEKMYLKMVENKIHYAVRDSGRKIGIDQMYDMYAPDGKLNDSPFTDRQQKSLNFKYFGIQTETGGRHDHNPFATQMSTEFALNAIFKGVPSDYNGKSGNWDNLSENEKIAASARYRQVSHVYDMTKALQAHGYNELLNKFGIEEDTELEKFVIPSEHMPAIEKILKEELLRRDVSQNLKDGFGWNKETSEWTVPLEAMANYKQIKQILFSYVDKYIATPAQNGSPMIQVPGVRIGSVDGKEIKTIRVKDKKTGKETNEVRYVSSGLKFYEAKYDKDGKRTSVARMEVMVTSNLPKQMRAHDRWKNATDQEIMDHLNRPEGKKLLEGIGYRVPTQETNSLEAYIIKGFLPDYLGDTIVVPEAITTKVGSDFDVDKMYNYLKNAYIDKDGNVQAVPYKGVGPKAIDSFRLLAKDLIGENTSKSGDEGVGDTSMNVPEELTAEDIDRITLENANKEQKIENLAQKLYKQSIQNEYYDSLGQTLLHPDNYERLVKPNDASYLKSISGELEKSAPEEFTADRRNSVLNMMYTSQARHAFVTGKDGVAVAANNQKSHSMMQMAKVTLEPKFINRLTLLERSFIDDGSILLPHNKVKVNYDYQSGLNGLVKIPFEQGRWLPTISGNKDNFERLISDNISQGIDGYVDVAKGAWIMNIIQDPMTSATFFTMMRFGINPETAAYFINQPIVREYIKAMARDGQTFITRKPDAAQRMEMFRMFPIDGIKAGAKGFNKDFLKIIKNRAKDGIDPEGLNGRLLDNISDFYKNKIEFSKDRNLDQHVILQEFLKYKVLSDNILSMQSALDWDTKSMADPNMQQRKLTNVDRARNSNIFDGVDDVFDATHLGSLMEKVKYSSRAISEAMFKSMGSPEVRKYINTLLRHLPTRMSSDDYQRAASRIEEHTISYAVQNNMFNDITNPAFADVDRSEQPINTRVKELLVDMKTAMATRLKELKTELSKDPNSDIARNEFINRLSVKTGKNIKQVKNIYLSSKPSDPTSADVLTNAMRELRDSKVSMTHNDFYNDLLTTTFLQSGISNSPLSLNQFIPAEDFSRMIKKAVATLPENEDTLDALVRTHSVFRNSWNDSRIVPVVKENWNFDENQMPIKSKFRLNTDFNIAWRKFREDPAAAWADSYSEKINNNGKKFIKYAWYQPFKIPTDSKEAQFDFVHIVSQDPNILRSNAQSVELEADPTRHFLLEKLKDIDGKAVILDEAYVYIPISTLGDGMKAQEQYSDEEGTPHSVLKTDGMQIPHEIPRYDILNFIKEFNFTQQDKVDQERSRQQSGLEPSDLDDNEKSRIFAEDEEKKKAADIQARKLGTNRDLKRLFYKFDTGALEEHASVERTDTTGSYYVHDSKVNNDNTITLELSGKQEGAKTHWVTINMEGDILHIEGSSGRELKPEVEDRGKIIFPDSMEMKLAAIRDNLLHGTKEEPEAKLPEAGDQKPVESTYMPLPDTFKKSGKTQEYTTEEGDKVQGYKLSFENHPNVHLFAQKVTEGEWKVREAGRGIQIGDGGRTYKDAVKSAIDLVNKLTGHEGFMRGLGLSKKDEHNIKPDGLPPLDLKDENNC